MLSSQEARFLKRSAGVRRAFRLCSGTVMSSWRSCFHVGYASCSASSKRFSWQSISFLFSLEVPKRFFGSYSICWQRFSFSRRSASIVFCKDWISSVCAEIVLFSWLIMSLPKSLTSTQRVSSWDIQSADEGFLFPDGLLPMFFVKTGSIMSVRKSSYSVGWSGPCTRWFLNLLNYRPYVFCSFFTALIIP